MKDLLLDRNGDLMINENGDITITDSVPQAVSIRLRWFFAEWRFAPQFGVPYFENILIKNPDLEQVRRAIRDEVTSVEGVIEVRNITVNLDKVTRIAVINLEFLADEIYREEIQVYV